MNRDDVIIKTVAMKSLNGKVFDVTLTPTEDGVSISMSDYKKKSKWEEQIDEWFKPRRLWEVEINPVKKEKIVCFNGKPIRGLVKDLIRTEIIEKICEEIMEALKEEPWRYDFSLAASAEKPINKVKARWLKGE